MPEKRITVYPQMLFYLDKDGGFVNSVTVASHSALVVISDLAPMADDMMTAHVVVTEDLPDGD